MNLICQFAALTEHHQQSRIEYVSDVEKYHDICDIASACSKL